MTHKAFLHAEVNVFIFRRKGRGIKEIGARHSIMILCYHTLCVMYLLIHFIFFLFFHKNKYQFLT